MWEQSSEQGEISAPVKTSFAADSAGAKLLSMLFLGQLHALQTSARFSSSN